jgi:phosphoribosylglycinamide formyltransferase-1
MAQRPRIVILISGRGSNMAAILSSALPVQVAAVISNDPEAGGLELAAAQGIPTRALNHRQYADRQSFDRALMECIDSYEPGLVVLAGFMRILTPDFVRHYHQRLINIHPSLLPSFPGLHTHARALEAGVRIHGCTVHFVTEELDSGPIVIQAAVPVLPHDTEALLSGRVLRQEHRIYPLAIRWWAEGKITWPEGRLMLAGELAHTSPMVHPQLVDQ